MLLLEKRALRQTNSIATVWSRYLRQQLALKAAGVRRSKEQAAASGGSAPRDAIVVDVAALEKVRQRSCLLKAVITAFPCVSLPFLAVPLCSQPTVALRSTTG
eukprot:SAG22_NODE_6498_length_846_cov_4.077644_2_plen_103_part_00